MEVKNPNSDQMPDLGATAGDGFKRRNNRGCKSKDFYNWPEQPFEEMDSPLAVQQYIQQLINRDPADIDEILRLPEGQELGAWKIEHLRLFCMQLNGLAARLQDCCYPETCNQMTATEQWIFLCAAHKQPNECPAIDYTRHALDSAASLLNSNKYFPSRVTIKESSVAKLGSVCRRVYRIFSHAYYHHFQVFDEFEKKTHLCGRFSKFVTMYELLSKESLIVPADGSKPDLGNDQKTNASPSDTTMIDAVASDTQVASDASKEVVTPKAEPKEVDVEKVPKDSAATKPPAETLTTATNAAPPTEVKPDIKPKIEEKTPPASTTWSPSQISTNTMVKSSSNAASKTTSSESPVKPTP